MNAAEIRQAIQWSPDYRSEWDSTPDQYAQFEIVGWGKSKRLGILRLGQLRAYVGVQHVDPDRSGWRLADAPFARFFVSVVQGRRTLALRTQPTLDDCLTFLEAFVPS